MLLLCFSDRGGVGFLAEVWVNLITNKGHQNPGDLSRSLSPSNEVSSSFYTVLHLCHQEACVSLLEQEWPQWQTDMIYSVSCRTWGEAILVQVSNPNKSGRKRVKLISIFTKSLCCYCCVWYMYTSVCVYRNLSTTERQKMDIRRLSLSFCTLFFWDREIHTESGACRLARPTNW